MWLQDNSCCGWRRLCSGGVGHTTEWRIYDTFPRLSQVLQTVSHCCVIAWLSLFDVFCCLWCNIVGCLSGRVFGLELTSFQQSTSVSLQIYWSSLVSAMIDWPIQKSVIFGSVFRENHAYCIGLIFYPMHFYLSWLNLSNIYLVFSFYRC